MKKTQINAVLGEYPHQLDFGFVEFPVGGENTTVFVTLRVSEHYLLRIVTARQQLSVIGDVKQILHDAAAAAQIVDGLEQRHQIHRDLRRRAGKQQAHLLQQQCKLEKI